MSILDKMTDTMVADYDYEQACLKWARELPDWMIRSYAQDYRNGDRDQATADAYEEYLRRWPNGARRAAEGAKMVKRCEKHQKRHAAQCVECRELNGLPVPARRSPRAS